MRKRRKHVLFRELHQVLHGKMLLRVLAVAQAIQKRLVKIGSSLQMGRNLVAVGLYWRSQR
ncbi:unnamed protein product [Strongylus vulgaris]|uniref:Uncharacterized protein n=1 Tax=Strongylus vulgaris TaxID=40348 RepID=A0A3P7JPF3_STRVU|nr:unnamed protein product [Strongylus vulgaris]